MTTVTATGKPLCITGLSKVYETRTGGRVEALTPISFNVAAGEFLVIVGPSGCGKSTLLQILAGILKPTDGTISVDGELITGPSLDRSMIFQSYALFPWLSVLDNVQFGLRRKPLSREQQRSIALQFLKLVGLSDFADKSIDELSGGMKQRVAIARAFAVNPSILLMDEPFGALDALTRRFLQRELLRIWQEQQRTVVFITHSVSEAIYLADRILVMSARPGRISAEWRLDSPRPRDVNSERNRQLEAEIYALLDAEIAKTFAWMQ
ncbi:MAG TPA: ABC transporter ATP-binding protein [Candidatus Acidoferrum sp.]|nr:ABC transporter ATP-binding protein [Candidatus Acidoferrum sp.]